MRVAMGLLMWPGEVTAVCRSRCVAGSAASSADCRSARPCQPEGRAAGWSRNLDHEAADALCASPAASQRVLVRLLVGQVAVPGVEFGQPLELVRELPQRPRRLLDPVLRHQAQQERAGGALHLW